VLWYGQPSNVNTTIDYFNYIFSSIFALESLIKIIGIGSRYFKDRWNIFDFIVSIISILGIIMEKSLNISGASSANIIRSIRVVRLFKMFRRLKSLKIIFETFLIALPALMNVGGLLLLLLYIFAVLSMNLFADIKLNDALDQNSHF
jgi:hypothetical protein